MAITTGFIISADGTLTATVEGVLKTLTTEPICTFSSIGDAESNLALLNPALVVCHVRNATDLRVAKGFARFALRECGVRGLLAITEDFLPSVNLQLVQSGFADCLARPLDLDRLRFWFNSFAAGLRFGRLSSERSQFAVPGVGIFFCRSPQYRQALDVAEKAALRDSPVLLRGETGTGKTMLARIIHQLSPRRGAPFVDINCGALPEHLVESELFGHIRGAFTGADHDRTGRFAAAEAGTLFLDEVDTLPLGVQTKLLRALDQKLFEPLGSDWSLTFRARIIAATNTSLDEKVECGEFRRDLYYRLNVVPIVLPPLRECVDDIYPLVCHHVERIADHFGLTAPDIDPALIAFLQSYDWPGNIRELINVVEQMIVLSDGQVLSAADLPEPLSQQLGVKQASSPLPRQFVHPSDFANQKPLQAAQSAGEKNQLLRTLKDVGNNRTLAAKALGISRVTLYKKLRKYGLIEFTDTEVPGITPGAPTASVADVRNRLPR